MGISFRATIIKQAVFAITKSLTRFRLFFFYVSWNTKHTSFSIVSYLPAPTPYKRANFKAVKIAIVNEKLQFSFLRHQSTTIMIQDMKQAGLVIEILKCLWRDSAFSVRHVIIQLRNQSIINKHPNMKKIMIQMHRRETEKSIRTCQRERERDSDRDQRKIEPLKGVDFLR